MLTLIRRYKGYLALCIVVVTLILIYIPFIERINDISEKIDEMGNLAPIALFFLRGISIIVPALPSTAYSLLAGSVLGFKNGLITICIADFCSCSISFLLARKFGRVIVYRLVNKKHMSKVEAFSQKHLENNFFIMTGSLMTGLFDFFSYGAGLSKVSWKRFTLALILSIMLSNPPIVALGASIFTGGRTLLVIGFVGILLLGIINNRLNMRKSSNNSV